MNDEEKQAIVEQAAKILAEDEVFTAHSIIENHTPHPYCIGPRHVGHAADLFCGMLSTEAILSAEKAGIHCATKGCQVPFEDHKVEHILLLKLTRDLGNKEAAQSLSKLKPMAEEHGLVGFGFENLDKEYTIEKATA